MPEKDWVESVSSDPKGLAVFKQRAIAKWLQPQSEPRIGLSEESHPRLESHLAKDIL